MSDRVRDTETLLEEAIAALRSERPDPELEAGAAARVRQRLEREAGARRSRPVSVDRIRSCDDYQALLPAYLDGSLGDARRLLVEDHLGECISCRRAVKKLRSADAVARREQPAVPSRRWLAVAASALLVMAAAAAVWLADPFGAAATLAQVRATDGSFFRMQPDGAMRLEPGEMVAEGDSLRTAPGAGAVVRLGDGSLVEMRERSEITLAESWGETTVRVARGSVIVEAAPQSQRRLYVATDEFLVAVTGTIFSVSHGTKGSRVSVLEGEVVVEQARHETVLSPGEQLVSRAGVAAVPVAEEVAWSRSEDRYRELLRELEALNQELGRTLASSGLRYSSRLLDLVPPGSDLYLAVPNLSEELFEMHRLFEERLAESPALREWWSRRISGTQTEVEVEDIVARIRDMGDHLGEEIVVTLDLDRPEGGEPLVLAEVDDPAAFAAVLGDEVARLNREIAAARGGGDGDSHGLRIVTDPAAAVAGDGEILLWLAGDLFR